MIESLDHLLIDTQVESPLSNNCERIKFSKWLLYRLVKVGDWAAKRMLEYGTSKNVRLELYIGLGEPICSTSSELHEKQQNEVFSTALDSPTREELFSSLNHMQAAGADIIKISASYTNGKEEGKDFIQYFLSTGRGSLALHGLPPDNKKRDKMLHIAKKGKVYVHMKAEFQLS